MIKYNTELQSVLQKYSSIKGNTFYRKDEHDVLAELVRIETKDGFVVCAPDNPLCLSSYVFLEQEEWFDPEIDLVRHYVQKDMNCIDIGAGFGAYALLASSMTGKGGCVFAFEPSSKQLAYLMQSKTDNQLDNLEVIPYAVSDKSGVGWIHQAQTSEFNTVLFSQSPESECVPLVNLDAWWESYSKPNIHLLKIDVNGHEPMVLQGARDFLVKNSPLVILAINSPEMKVTASVKKNRSLCLKILQHLGYEFYTYLPSQNALINCNLSQNISPCLLNIVACKHDRIHDLEKKQLIDKNIHTYFFCSDNKWEKYISCFDYYKHFLAVLNNNTSQSTEYINAFNLLCSAQYKNKFTIKQRIQMLDESLNIFSKLYENGDKSGALCFNLSRVLYELGQRDKSLGILFQLSLRLQAGELAQFESLFLPPLPGDEAILVNSTLNNWCVTRLQESILYLSQFSLYFANKDNLSLLDSLANNLECTARVIRIIYLNAIKYGYKPQNNRELISVENKKNNLLWNGLTSSYHLQEKLRFIYSKNSEDKNVQKSNFIVDCGLWDAFSNDNQTRYHIFGALSKEINEVRVFCDNVLMKSITIREQKSKYNKFEFVINEDILKRIKRQSSLRIVCDRGGVRNVNGFFFQNICGFSDSNDLQDLFSRGWFITKKGNLVLPLSLDSDKRSLIFALYTELNAYFKKNFNYNLWVAHGSLLGFWREKALLPFDDDFDLAYLSRMKTGSQVMYERIHIVSKMIIDNWNIQVTPTGLIKPFPHGVSKRTEKNKFLDIMPGWLQDNHFFCMNWTMLALTREDILPLRELQIYDTKFLIPNNPDMFLECKYGRDWRVPDQGYTAKRPDGSDAFLDQGLATRAELALFGG